MGGHAVSSWPYCSPRTNDNIHLRMQSDVHEQCFPLVVLIVDVQQRLRSLCVSLHLAAVGVDPFAQSHLAAAQHARHQRLRVDVTQVRAADVGNFGRVRVGGGGDSDGG